MRFREWGGYFLINEARLLAEAEQHTYSTFPSERFGEGNLLLFSSIKSAPWHLRFCLVIAFHSSLLLVCLDLQLEFAQYNK